MNIDLVCVLSSIAWGIAPVFGKLGLKNLSPLAGLTIRTVITTAFVFGTFVAASGFASLRHATLTDCAFLAVESLLATFAGDLAYYVALKHGDVSSTASILAASPVVTLWIAAAMLKEQVSVYQVAGTVLVFFGLLLVMRG